MALRNLEGCFPTVCIDAMAYGLLQDCGFLCANLIIQSGQVASPDEDVGYL